MKKKIKKFFNKPHIFIRDYFNKKYPISNIEQPYLEEEEFLLIQADEKLESMIPDFPIDVVFTWVDNSDEKWLKKYYAALKESDENNLGLYASDTARFENHNELYYSVHAVKKFMPWVRNIFIVTDNQIPNWLNTNNNFKIKIIDHKEIISEQYLPTFNSHVIEAHLHKIPNLSEYFIYFNDDVFVARKLQPTHFFEGNGIASIFLADKQISKMRKRGVITPTLTASERSIELLRRFYNHSVDNPLIHTYIPLKKSAFEKVWGMYETEVNSFLGNKFRTNTDLNMASFLVPWSMYLSGESVSKREICYYFNIRSAHSISQYKKLLSKKEKGEQPHSFCANDFNSKQAVNQYQENLIEMLSLYYNF
ncbi:stealth family protein [Kingella kingae]|uniref:stealth family protein n=1 Tax=Kingella kingae TaxID=504 RepID=UPI0025509F8F|nr:stealth family protein [Kingella kingae]MDK4564075.1 stealth family protein [Kingella kingae]MDK4577739.1 stealth family protein [Kingella kingae]MDK4608238.1 stealth family protein [Kingella kingae]MDK4626213.1 stealth family protein [Kingella kingae]MDK4674041.1 stealth family protein [Kingella kingae]